MNSVIKTLKGVRKKAITGLSLSTIVVSSLAPFAQPHTRVNFVRWDKTVGIHTLVEEYIQDTKEEIILEGDISPTLLFKRGSYLFNLYNEENSSIKAGPLIGAYNGYFCNETGIGIASKLSTSDFTSKFEAMKWLGNGVYFQIGFDVNSSPFRFYSTFSTNLRKWGRRNWGGDVILDAHLQMNLSDNLFIEPQVYVNNSEVVYSVNFGIKLGGNKVSKGIPGNCTSTASFESSK